TRRARVAPPAGLGGGHTACDRGARRAGPPDGGGPVGARRAVAAADAGYHSDDHLGPPLAAVRGTRVLRLQAVQPRQRRTVAVGGRACRLDAARAPHTGVERPGPIRRLRTVGCAWR